MLGQLIGQSQDHHLQVVRFDMSKKKTPTKPKQRVRLLKAQDEKAYVEFINDIPTKYGLPLLKFLEGLEQKEI